MVGGEELKRLEMRLQALVLESSLQRLTLDTEWRKLNAAAARLRAGVDPRRSVVPYLVVLAPLAGFLLARLGGRAPPTTVVDRLVSLVRWVPLLAALRRAFQPPRQPPAERPVP